MKKYSYFDGLLVIHPLISARYSSFTYSEKNNKHFSPPLKQAKHIQAIIPEFQTTHNKKYKRNIATLLGLFWLWTLAKFYSTEKSRRIPRWQLEDLAPLKIIKPMPSGSGITTACIEKSSAWRSGEVNRLCRYPHIKTSLI